MEGYDGILVPGGFGKRGIDGMLNAIRFARENHVPYFGICLGMQTMVIEFARQRLRAGLGGLDGIQSGHAAPRDLQTARTERHRRFGWHHAAGRLAVPFDRGQPGAKGLRDARYQRTPSASFRIQPRVRGTADRLRSADYRRNSRSDLRRDLRDTGSPLDVWAASSTRSSRASRWSRTRCSKRSWAPLMVTAGSDWRRWRVRKRPIRAGIDGVWKGCDPN